MLRPLARLGRSVILYPPLSPELTELHSDDLTIPEFRGYKVGHKVGMAFFRWVRVAEDARKKLGLKVTVSKTLEETSTDVQRQQRWDMGDWVIHNRIRTDREVGMSPTLRGMIGINPKLGILIQSLDLVEAV